MEEKLYAIYGYGAVPQTREMIMGKAIFFNHPIGEYTDGNTTYRVWFLEPPATQAEANKIARKIAENASGTTGTILLAALGITIAAGIWNYFFGKD